MAMKKKAGAKAKRSPAKKGVKRTVAKVKAAARKLAPKKKPTARKPTPKRSPDLTATTKMKVGAPGTGARSTATPAVQAGNPAPDFSLPGDDGKTHSLSDHRGQPVVLYFYPKDDTPGCTREACDFRDNIARVQGAGAALYGVSKDSLASHGKFREKYQLNFPLLSDADLSVHKAYGAWGMKTLYGKTSEGTIRSTFLIGPDGRLARVWPKVQVDGHAQAVIDAIQQLRQASPPTPA